MATQTEVAQIRAPVAAAGPASRGRLYDVAVIGVPTAVALALCLYELTTRSLWVDEAATVAIAGQHAQRCGARSRTTAGTCSATTRCCTC